MVNILVLTHKDMRSNPINLILTGIAVADCLVMIEYIPFTIHMYLMDDQDRNQEERVSFLPGLNCLRYQKTQTKFAIFPKLTKVNNGLSNKNIIFC